MIDWNYPLIWKIESVCLIQIIILKVKNWEHIGVSYSNMTLGFESHYWVPPQYA